MEQIFISDAAQAHFRKLLDTQEEGTNIRIFVVNPGTPGAECGVSYCPPNSVEATDTEMKYDTFSAFVDEISLPFLEDAEIDYVTEELGAQLTLKAPNAKMRKVADDAPLIERVEYVIQTQINPQLASHGGKITLIEITDDGYAVLQFGGGCNGCSMVDVTLKDGVEKQLVALFPNELKGARVIMPPMINADAINTTTHTAILIIVFFILASSLIYYSAVCPVSAPHAAVPPQYGYPYCASGACCPFSPHGSTGS